MSPTPTGRSGLPLTPGTHAAIWINAAAAAVTAFAGVAGVVPALGPYGAALGTVAFALNGLAHYLTGNG